MMINVIELKRKIIDSLIVKQPSLIEKKFNSIAKIFTGESTNSEEKAKYSIKTDCCYPYVSTKDISMKGFVNYENGMYIPKGVSKFSIAPEKSILLCIEGGNAGNKIAIINTEVCFVNKLCCFNVFGADNRFIYYYLLSNNFRNNFKEKMTGLIGGVSVKKIKELLIPLPSIDEQRVIANKLDEIFAELDKIDEQQTKLQSIQDKMESKILKLAIQGKLVEQRPEEGTGEELFNLIQNEKQQLIKEGKIKKEKMLPAIEDDEIPFDIPSTWKWVRWGDLSFRIQYGYNAPAKETGRLKMVRISDIQNEKVLWETVPYCDINENEIQDYLLKNNDILFARTGGTVGKSYIVSDVHEEAVFAGYLIRTQYSENLVPMYLKFFMNTSLYWRQLRDGTIATAQPNCNGKTLSKMIVPLPPYEEQKRIVAKIEELLPQCKIV